jgi:N,N'-diacetyllegionaminate synthase
VGQPCFIIAEAGVNHNGSLEKAFELVDTAAHAKVDAVKFQTFIAEKLVTSQAPKAAYQVEMTGGGETQYDMLKRLELSRDAFRRLSDYCQHKGVLFISTPFDEESVDFLDCLDVPLFKVGSGEITNLPLLIHIARKGKAMLLSTGMATLGEVEKAVLAIQASGDPDLILLHCVSNYPADPSDVNLRAMQTLQSAFGVPAGYSDHTLGIEISLAAVTLGACVIEKHFTLDCNLPGPDHKASLEPDGLVALVKGIRSIEKALGDGRKLPAANEANVSAAARRSLVAARDIPAGTRLTEEMIAIRRPGTGLPPAMQPFLIGRRVKDAIPAGTLFSLEMLA